MVVGAFSAIGPLFAIGYILLVIGASVTHIGMGLTGIAIASYARGLMSPSYPSLFKRTFDTQQHFEAGYPVNYSVNNVGAFISQYLFPLLVLAIGFHGGFMISLGMAILAVVILVISHKSFVAVGAELNQRPVSTNDDLNDDSDN